MKDQSESAYSISWELVASAIRRRKYLGTKALEEMTDDKYGITVMIPDGDLLGEEARKI